MLRFRASNIHLYTPAEVEKVRRAAQAAAQVRDRVAEAIQPGMTTLDVDNLAGVFIRETGGVSGSLGYHGFPRQICVSVNDEVVHGIGRAERCIAPGDLVKVDVVVNIDGFFGDTARTVCAGFPEPVGLPGELMRVTREALAAGIERAHEGNCINDIGAAVERVAEAAGFSCVRDMIGHGCGRKMHEAPDVPNYRQSGKTPRLAAGMIICIEPMINVGTWRITVDAEDHWTVRSADHSLSAHFEHQILITNKEPIILTYGQNGLH